MSGDSGADSGTPRPLEWRMLADATCAGLTALIPLPLVDLLFEGYFRRRMVHSIARLRGVQLEPWLAARLGRGGPLLDLRGCLMLPFRLVLYVLKKLWRKIVYILAVADASEQVSAYWHRAFLLDYLLREGYLDPGRERGRAVAAFDQALREVDTSPLKGMARQVVSSAQRGVLRLLRRARRESAAPVTQDQKHVVEAQWGAIESVLRRVVVRFEACLQDRAPEA